MILAGLTLQSSCLSAKFFGISWTPDPDDIEMPEIEPDKPFKKQIINDMPDYIKKAFCLALAGIIIENLFKEPVDTLVVNPIKNALWWMTPEAIQRIVSNDRTVNTDPVNTIPSIQPEKTLENDIAGKKFHPALEETVDKLTRGYEKKPVLLYGPSGTGKTAYSEVIANELSKRLNKGVDYFTEDAPNLLKRHVGDSPEIIKNLGDAAEESTKKGKIAVIFIDEIDAVYTGIKSESQYGVPTANAVNALMSKVSQNPNMFMFATTNKTGGLTAPALRRCKCIEIPLPNLEQRTTFFTFNLQKEFAEHFDGNLDIESMDQMINQAARLTEGMNYGDMQTICADTMYILENAGRINVTWEDLQKAILDKKQAKILEEESTTIDYTQVSHNKKSSFSNDLQKRKKNSQNEQLIASLLKNHDSQHKSALQKKWLAKKKEEETKLTKKDTRTMEIEEELRTYKLLHRTQKLIDRKALKHKKGFISHEI